jgi:ABC-type uncharacterized transport system involved in gliding motility auxiliary subunit
MTRLGTIAFTSVVVVLGLLVAVNYLSSRRNKRWDLTANQARSLSAQTRQILDKLDARSRSACSTSRRSSIGSAIG